ncbi:glycerol 3-phosphate dehydrogenase (NAD(P)+) [Malonomonas rubra DSM 5091]|uniref:Glycerol-3-phosphate dehydrogenase [NAD(P)+] n=1 Tax=Malonomonas rubra DSM 5091 TaxID=1122189 RepID=A0A1M6JTV3_MALRU|nr:NAD(P)H-dependent glycerol-3-phosphate dehydrogenase [Malonomonas rubra]SHJ50040.1 glycerol 3-phosphate dehydrogenase (NAD(P)+) [Malonomonas rubra DSM 5091]
MKNNEQKYAVIGAGSWGTTLANLLAEKGNPVSLWVYEEDLAKRMQQTGVNDVYLPGFTLSPNLTYTSDLQQAVSNKEMLLFVTPSQVTRQVLQQALPYVSTEAKVVCASKGIENESLMLLSQVFEELLPRQMHNQLGFLSGPSFAKEVVQGMPTAVVVAAHELAVAEEIQAIFSTDNFRVYTHDDIIGVELGGSMKNVIALAAGVVDGLGLGHNSRAGLITRGLAEMTRLGLKLGGRAETFAGLAGMGDLVLTCTGDLSRNRTVGMELGKGRTLDDILAGMQMVAEGVKTTLSAYQLAQKLGVEVPIIEQMYQILYQEKDPRQAVSDLMLRDLKAEAVRSDN